MPRDLAAVDLDLRLVRYFVTVAELGTFGRAAAALHIAQPHLSRQIRRLEEHLGAQLLERTSQGSDLTDAGRVFLADARVLLRAAATAAEYARASVAEPAITIACARGHDVSRVIAALRARGFGSSIRTLTIQSPDAARTLRERRPDVLITRMPVMVDGHDVATVANPRRAVVLPVGHPLAGAASVTLEDLDDAPIVRHAQPDWDRYLNVDPRPDGGRAPNGPVVDVIDDGIALVLDNEALMLMWYEPLLSSVWPGLVVVPVADAPPTTIQVVTRTGDERPIVQACREEVLRLLGPQPVAPPGLAVVADAL